MYVFKFKLLINRFIKYNMGATTTMPRSSQLKSCTTEIEQLKHMGTGYLYLIKNEF